ncbi:MAG: hypothetical protein ABFD96_00065 [Armatimonadia bacterium]
MSYDGLVSDGRIRPHGLTESECKRHIAELLELAEMDLFDASIAQRPLDRRHNSAYEAARATAEAIMAAEGYRRAGGEGQHAVLFVFLNAVDDGRFSAASRHFDVARRLRNKTHYEKAGIVSEATATGTILRAESFVAETRAWLIDRHPQFVTEKM